MEAVVFIGIQGSGKSSFYRERFSTSHVQISLDLLKTRKREQRALDECLRTMQSFVIDNTNPTLLRATQIHPCLESGPIRRVWLLLPVKRRGLFKAKLRSIGRRTCLG